MQVSLICTLMILTLIGLPGVGKTRTALTLAAMWPRPVLVLHTDLLKVTARRLGVDALRGAGWADPARARAAQPLLQAHADKAARDGYDLIIEGTLALGFAHPQSATVCLVLDEGARRARVSQKHPSAREALEGASLARYRQALASAGAVCLGAGAPPADLAAQLCEMLGMAV